MISRAQPDSSLPVLAGGASGGKAAPEAFQPSGPDRVQGNPNEGPAPSQQQNDNMQDAGNDFPDEDMSDGGGDDPQQGALAGAGQPQMLTDTSLAQDALPHLPRTALLLPQRAPVSWASSNSTATGCSKNRLLGQASEIETGLAADGSCLVQADSMLTS